MYSYELKRAFRHGEEREIFISWTSAREIRQIKGVVGGLPRNARRGYFRRHVATFFFYSGSVVATQMRSMQMHGVRLRRAEVTEVARSYTAVWIRYISCPTPSVPAPPPRASVLIHASVPHVNPVARGRVPLSSPGIKRASGNTRALFQRASYRSANWLSVTVKRHKNYLSLIIRSEYIQHDRIKFPECFLYGIFFFFIDA